MHQPPASGSRLTISFSSRPGFGYTHVLGGDGRWWLSYEHGSPGEAPSRDNLLVLYLAEPGAVETVAARLESSGHRSVEPENPYWKANSITFEDPDGWRVVLVRGAGFTA